VASDGYSHMPTVRSLIHREGKEIETPSTLRTPHIPFHNVRAKAPLRLSFAGGGTDVPPFPETEGGVVLLATIDRYAYGSVSPHSDDRVSIQSVDFGL
jgi:hypothetical protein